MYLQVFPGIFMFLFSELENLIGRIGMVTATKQRVMQLGGVGSTQWAERQTEENLTISKISNFAFLPKNTHDWIQKS